MTAVRLQRMSEEEYLAFDRASSERHEFFGGEIFLMTGGSPVHNEVTLKFSYALMSRLRGKPCKVYGQDLRVQIDETGLYTYPDVLVVCGGLQTLDARKDTVLNPGFIAEVLSPSIESWDRGGKFQHYRGVASLQTYALVSPHEPLIEVYERATDHWLYSDYRGMSARMRIGPLGVEIPLAEIYQDVEFDVDDQPGGLVRPVG
ncbi:MAG: Uma2 family endonuclease [Panacagrimonas sp.]